MSLDRLHHRAAMLRELDRQRGDLEQSATSSRFDRHRQSAISLLASPSVRNAFDVTNADDKTQERYGRNSFGWSLLMAFRLVEAGVNLVQVNLGNNETWDTHGEIFHRMKKIKRYWPKAILSVCFYRLLPGLPSCRLVLLPGSF